MSLPTTDLVFNHKADAITGLSDGDAVAAWNDSFGSVNYAQSTTANKPTYKTNQINSLPCVRGDGSNDWLEAGGTTTFRHYFVVVRINSSTFPDYSGIFTGIGGGDEAILIGESGTTHWYLPVTGGTFYNDGSATNAAPMNAWAVIEVTISSDKTITPQIFRDRVYSRYAAADIAEDCAYSTIQTSTALDNIRDYFHTKYFVTPTDTTPPSDVTNLATSKISNSQIDIDSDAATDNIAVAGYQTQVSDDAGSTWHTLASTTKAISFVSGNTYFPTTPGTYSLTFRRKAFDATPNYSDNWSNIPTAISITVPVTPPVASFTISASSVVVGGTITLTDTSTNTPTSRQWKLDEENLATSSPYALDTTGLEIGTHTIDLQSSNSGGSDNAEPQTFEVIESFIAEFFEKLEICKLFNITDIELVMPLLEADFGDGYGAGVLSGKSSGLQKWTISADPILDLADYNIDFLVDGEPQTDTPLNYFWEFFRRHIALGNKPFYFVEPRTGRKFLASFVELRLSLKVFTKVIYGTGIEIKQRRVVLEGLEFRESDGSINE